MYQPFHRKYRPKIFSAILGQDTTVTTLKNALKFNRSAHAYLFCGSRGTGKTTLARLFAKALNCLQLTSEQEPCNTCASCLEMNESRSLDVIEIDGASNRGIEDIRGVNETIGYATSSSKYKIYIIDEVHMLTKEAFNALLKTLEEPPENVKFFFATTEPHKILPTIISRCQRFDLNRIPSEQICHKLKNIAQDLNLSIQEEVYELIAALAEGGLRDAESLLDQLVCYSDGPITYEAVTKILGVTPRSTLFKLDQAIDTQQLSFAFDLAKEIFSTGKDLLCFFDSLIEHFRTHLLYKLKIPISSYLSEEDRTTYLETSSFYTQEQCFYNLDFLMQWHKELSKLPFKRISLEMILLQLIRSKNRVSLPTLVRRLEELSQTLPPPPRDSSEINSTDSKQRNDSGSDNVSLAEVRIPPSQEQSSNVQVISERSLNFATPLPENPPQQKLEKPLSSPLAGVSRETPEPLPQEKESPPRVAPETPALSSRHEVLLRFASIELEGTLSKD